MQQKMVFGTMQQPFLNDTTEKRVGATKKSGRCNNKCRVDATKIICRIDATENNLQVDATKIFCRSMQQQKYIFGSTQQ